jgi:large subunit ribosomal protein L28
MAHQCDICGKGPVVGNQVTIRGKAKYLGGVGTKVTGINRRQFKPNLQKVRVTVGGTNKSIFACTQCLRSGAVVKRIRATPFRLPGDVRSQKAAGKKAAAAKKTAAKKK